MSDRTTSSDQTRQPLFQFPASSPQNSSNIPGISAPSSISATCSSTKQQQPSQIRGHLQYVKGVVSDAIGRATSSESWQASGQATQHSGINEMRAAKELANREGPNQSLTATANTGCVPGVGAGMGAGAAAAAARDKEAPRYASKVGDTGFLRAEGKAESLAGKVFGCAGMVRDGEEKERSANVLERTGDSVAK